MLGGPENSLKKATWLLLWLTLSCGFSRPAQILNTNARVTTNDAAPRSFKFKADAGKIVLQVAVDTRPGTVEFQVRSPEGRSLGQQSAGVATMNAWSLTVTNGGECELVVTPDHTAGYWRVRIHQIPPLRALYEQMVSGVIMMVVATAGVFVWWIRNRVQWRWFWAGAGIWTVGVVLKFAVAIPLNSIIFGKSEPATGLMLCFGSVYLGLLTGIFEIGATLAAALLWRRLAAEPARAVAVGLGAGAFEAFLLGLGAALGALVPLAVGQSESVLKALAPIISHTPLWWLAGPVERMIAISGHTAGRVLVLRAVACGRWLGFWAGFAWLSAVDLLAGAALLTGMTVSGSLWRIELMILPFGILSLPLVWWAIRRWPGVKSNEPCNDTEPIATAQVEQEDH